MSAPILCANRLRSIELGDGLFCQILLQDAGLQMPEQGDKCRVHYTLFLPTEEDSRLHEKITFKGRLSIINEPLDTNWGHLTKNKLMRFKRQTAFGNTWADAFKNADTLLRNEVAKIREALQKRKEAKFSEGYQYIVMGKFFMEETDPEYLEWEEWTGEKASAISSLCSLLDDIAVHKAIKKGY